MDADFAKEVEAAIESHREPLEPTQHGVNECYHLSATVIPC
jgi:hypothetical protein